MQLDWGFLASFTAVAVAGAIAGTALAARVPQAALKRGFAVFLLAMGGFVLYRNRDAFRAIATSTPPAAPATAPAA